MPSLTLSSTGQHRSASAASGRLRVRCSIPQKVTSAFFSRAAYEPHRHKTALFQCWDSSLDTF